MRDIKNKIVMFTAAALSAATLASCGVPEQLSTPAVTGEFKTEILSTGKSDAIILESESHTIVIDCGEDNDGDEVLEYLASEGVTYVDYLFITHFDKDHVGGAAEVIENIPIGEIITPDYEGSVSEYDDFIAAAETAEVKVTRLKKNMSFIFDDVLYEAYPPQKSVYEEEDNDYSIVVKVTHGDDALLFTGDAESERLNELYNQLDVSADFLKIPHHGRLDDESAAFIAAVNPTYAVVTCSKKEGAEEELLAILDSADAETYLTRDGAVTAVSTGGGIIVTQTTK